MSKTLSLTSPHTMNMSGGSTINFQTTYVPTVTAVPTTPVAPAAATVAPTLGATRASSAPTSEHGWLLVPPAAWTAPLTAEQKARIPVGQDNIVITEEGEVWARLAGKNACWVNAANECRKPETHASSYESWQSFPKNFIDANGAVTQIKVGCLAYDTGHAPKGNLSWEQVVQHYLGELKSGRAGRWTQRALDDPTTSFAMGRIHIDHEHDGSIWFHGAVAPHRSIVEVVLASSAGISGEWMRRAQGGKRHLAGICVVNTPAFRSAFTDRLAASVSIVPNEDADRFTTFGEGWANSLEDLIGALPEGQHDTYLDRIASAVELAPESSLSARWTPASDDAKNLELEDSEIAETTTGDDEANLDAGENVDENGDPLSMEEIAAKMGRQAAKALAESIDWRAASSTPVTPPDTYDFEITAMAEGVRSRDGRLIMKGALEMPFSPQPIVWQEAGLGHEEQQVVGWGWVMERRPRTDGAIDCVVKCTWARDNAGNLLPLADKLSNMKPKAGTDVLGLRVSIDGGAYEASVVWDEVNLPQIQPVVDNGQYLGAYSFPYFVFSSLEIGMISFVGLPAIAQAGVREVASIEIPELGEEPEPFDRIAGSIEMGGISLKMTRAMAKDLSTPSLRWTSNDVRSTKAGRVLRVLSRLSA